MKTVGWCQVSVTFQTWACWQRGCNQVKKNELKGWALLHKLYSYPVQQANLFKSWKVWSQRTWIKHFLIKTKQKTIMLCTKLRTVAFVHGCVMTWFKMTFYLTKSTILKDPTQQVFWLLMWPWAQSLFLQNSGQTFLVNTWWQLLYRWEVSQGKQCYLQNWLFFKILYWYVFSQDNEENITAFFHWKCYIKRNDLLYNNWKTGLWRTRWEGSGDFLSWFNVL